MRKSKFTEEQIAFALHQADTGVSVEEACRKVGVSPATFYAWKKKHAGVGVSELRRLRQLEDENKKLKQLVADLSLDKVMLQDVLKKSSKAGAAQAARRPSDRTLPRECEPGLPALPAEPRGLVPEAQAQSA